MPGQFLIFHFTADTKASRAYSLCSSPAAAGEYFEVTVGRGGEFAEYFDALKPGSDAGLVARGPFGKWVYDGSISHAALVSGGAGLSPFRAMCLFKSERKLAAKMTVFCAAKTPEDFLYKNEYDDWRNNGIDVNEKITRPGAFSNWGGETGRWTADAVCASANDAAAIYYLCGPRALVEDLRGGLQRLGISLNNIKTERWDDYNDLF